MSTRGLRSRTMNPLLEAFTFFVLRPLTTSSWGFGESSAGSSSLPPVVRPLAATTHLPRAPGPAERAPHRPRACPTEEFVPDDEARNIRAVIDEISAFTRENYPPGGPAIRQLRDDRRHAGRVHGARGHPGGLRHGLFTEPRTYAAYVRLAGPGPLCAGRPGRPRPVLDGDQGHGRRWAQADGGRAAHPGPDPGHARELRHARHPREREAAEVGARKADSCTS